MRAYSSHRALAVLALVATFASFAFAADTYKPDTYKIVRAYPHDPQAYTQGLIYLDGHLYESTGLNGRSSLRMVDLDTGHVEQQHIVGKQHVHRNGGVVRGQNLMSVFDTL